MTRISNSWIILTVLAGLTSWTLGQQQQAQVPNRMVSAKTGLPSNFTCESNGLPISVCLWELIGTSTLLNFHPGNIRPGQSAQPGYTYLGEGLEKGQCGLVISQVKDSDNGTWQCTLITTTGATYRGTVALGILQKPDAPLFNPQTLPTLYEEDGAARVPGQAAQPTKITCYSARGSPKPTFKWFIDNEPLYTNLGPINETKQVTQQGEISYTFQDLINYRFTYRDNGKKLRCVLEHDALSENDKKEVALDLLINYRPRSADNGKESDRFPVQAQLGEQKLISMNISANPRPTLITWTVDGKVIREGENTDKYEAALAKEVALGIWEVTLKVKEVDEEDLNKKFDLKLENNLGTAEYSISISSNSAGGLNAGGILSIILAILAILIIIAVAVVYSRAKGILCFKGDDGTASEKERMDGGSTGGGAVSEEKPTRNLSSRLSALYENLMAKKKDKTAAVDEEAGKDKDAKEKEAVEGGEEPLSDEKEKKPEDIVYAELDLARSGGDAGGQRPEVVVRCADDKTEYAEIVGVVAKNVDETSPKKSPQGSPK